MNGPVTRLPSPIPVRLSLGGNFLLWDLSPGPGETFGPIPARCSSSFPGAFEPHWVDVDTTDTLGDQRWASDAGRANYGESQFLVDGGVLLNKPIRPALEAVYRQPAEAQVRRILAYVAPSPGEPASPPVPRTGTHPEPPTAREVLLGVLTRLRSTDSVSRELTEIRTRNQEARSRRRVRDRLAAAMTELAGPLSEKAWPGYREVRLDYAARTVGQLLAAGQPEEPGRWSETELISALRRQNLRFVPADSDGKAETGNDEQVDKGVDQAVRREGKNWDWGQTTVQRLGDMVADVLKRAVWLAADQDDQKRIAECRGELYDTLGEVREERRTLNAYWPAAPRGNARTGIGKIPRRAGGNNAPATNTAALDEWLGKVLTGWDCLADPDASAEEGLRARQALLYKQAQALAQQLWQSGDAISRVLAKPNRAVDPTGTEQQRLQALYDYLLAGGPGHQTLERMLRLDVVQLCFSGANQEVEQEVELIQVSSLNPDRLTGIQLHHFGAFYRQSWRINDWLQGRMDGALQIVRLLLSPERLRQCGYAAPAANPDGPDGKAAETLLGSIRALAVPDADPDRPWLEEQWERDKDACLGEITRVVQVTSPAASTTPPQNTAMDTCARALTRPIQTEILREDLPALAAAIRAEGEDAPAASQGWLRNYASEVAAGPPSTAALWRLWEEADPVGAETIAGDAGSDTFARTTTHAATVLANNVGSVTKPKAVAALLAAFRGYALTVWAMVNLLTRKSHFGARAVELAVAAGGVLIAVAIFVPGMPLGFTLAGVLLLLAGLSAAALLTKSSRGLGRRLLVAAALIAAALGGYAYCDYTRNGSASAVWSLAIKAGVGILVVLLGWWLAQVRPARRKLSSSRPSSGTSRSRARSR